jgi:hypothetical protein
MDDIFKFDWEKTEKLYLVEYLYYKWSKIDEDADRWFWGTKEECDEWLDKLHSSVADNVEKTYTKGESLSLYTVKYTYCFRIVCATKITMDSVGFFAR